MKTLPIYRAAPLPQGRPAGRQPGLKPVPTDRRGPAIFGKRPERFQRGVGPRAALDRGQQLIEQGLVGHENGAFGSHSRDRGFDARRTGKQKLLDDKDLIAEIEEAQTRLQDTHIRLAPCHDHLLLAEVSQVLPDCILFRQVEKVFLENLRAVLQMPGDLFRQRSLIIDGPLQGHQNRNVEIAK